MIALPIAALALLWSIPEGTTDGLPLLGLSLEPVRVDSLARVFATAFCLAALLAVIYGLSVRDRVQQIAILVYAGSAIGGSLAGDLVTCSCFGS
jgi:multicomponent Na+:H+ antiporter subunit D